jgi:HEAT repeat protein
MKFDQPGPHSRELLKRELASNDQSRICRALIAAALHETDRLYVESLIIKFLSHADAYVRGIAALAAGHVARIHGALTVDRIVPLVERLLNDPEPQTRGTAEDALEDIRRFLAKSKPN